MFFLPSNTVNFELKRIICKLGIDFRIARHFLTWFTNWNVKLCRIWSSDFLIRFKTASCEKVQPFFFIAKFRHKTLKLFQKTTLIWNNRNCRSSWENRTKTFLRHTWSEMVQQGQESGRDTYEQRYAAVGRRPRSCSRIVALAGRLSKTLLFLAPFEIS